MRRRVALLSVTALALAALTVAGVMVAVRTSRSPRPVPELAGAFKPVPGQLASVSVGPHGQTLGAGYACSGCGTKAETDRPLIVEQNGSEWSRLAVPDIPGSSRLTGVSVAVDGTIYAVGYTCPANCGTIFEVDRPLILRRRDGVWSWLTYSGIAGSAHLTGVSVAAAGIIFAVGFACVAHCAASSELDRPFILRSDGSRWWRVASQSVPRRGTLAAVTTQPGGNVWAVGGGCTPICGKTLILRWDGSAWSQVPSPSPGQTADLFDVSMTRTAGWASGWTYCSTRCHSNKQVSHTLILRWNGHSWLPVKSPDAEPYNLLYGVAAAGRSAWAVGAPSCGACGSSSVLRTVIFHWNGSDWSPVTPTPGGNRPLTGIAAEPEGGAIAVGRTAGVGPCTAPCANPPEVDHTLILRWNGSRWSVVR